MSARALLLLALALAGSALAPPARAQDAPRATAQLGTGVLKLGDRTVIQVRLENARRGTLQELPDAPGLALGPPSGPSYQSFTSIVGARVEERSTVGWTIPVRALEVGEHAIPPLAVETGGQVLHTRALSIHVVADMEGSELGFVEVSPSAESVVEGQPFSLEIRFGWDAALEQVNYADLILPWWGEIPGAMELERDFPPPGARRVEGVRVNTTGTVTVEELPQVTRDGRRFRAFRLVRSFLPTRAGTIDLPPAFLNFGVVQEVTGGFFALDRRLEKIEDWHARDPARHVRVVPLPEEGQPTSYTGAVGSLEAEARADVRDVVAGESIKLTVTWTGAGNLEFFGAPDVGRLAAFEGFRVYGRTEEKAFDRRVATYDLAPLSPEVTAIPPVPLDVYDPAAGRYVTVATDPIPIRVRPLEGAVELAREGEEEAGVERDLRDIDVRPIEGGGSGGGAAPPTAAVVGAVALAPLAWLVARTAARRRGDPASPRARRRRAARRRLARALRAARTPEEELAALRAFLAARSGEPEPAWAGRDPLAWSRDGARRRADEDAARELARLLERLERAVYAGDGGPVGRSEVLRVADRWIGGGA